MVVFIHGPKAVVKCKCLQKKKKFCFIYKCLRKRKSSVLFTVLFYWYSCVKMLNNVTPIQTLLQTIQTLLQTIHTLIQTIHTLNQTIHILIQTIHINQDDQYTCPNNPFTYPDNPYTCPDNPYTYPDYSPLAVPVWISCPHCHLQDYK